MNTVDVLKQQICTPVWLYRAWLQAAATAGYSQLLRNAISEYGEFLKVNLEDLGRRLANGSYVPAQVKQVNSLNTAIALLEDHIAQYAVKEVLEQVFEPTFLDCNYGDRPHRTANMAITRVIKNRLQGDCSIIVSEIEDYLCSCETFQDAPDYQVADATLGNAKKITTSNSQQKDFLWSAGSKLIEYTSAKGDKLQGALFLPANYEPGKSYPTVVYIYEKLSQGLNSYAQPT